MKKIFIASKNRGKIDEIKYFLKDFEVELLSPFDLSDIPDVKETGKTFEENALIKAKAIYDKINIPVLADDSGLEVDYLNGEPGVYSARYAGLNATDVENCQKLLDKLKDAAAENRKAGFKCVLVLYDGLIEKYFEGKCRGQIINQARGSKGFGYDPVFLPNGYDKTFAELDIETKNRISHRGKALQNLRIYLQSVLKN